MERQFRSMWKGEGVECGMAYPQVKDNTEFINTQIFFKKS